MQQTKITGIIGPKGSGKTYLSSRRFGLEKNAVFFDVAEDDSVLPFATAIIEAPRDAYEVRRAVMRDWNDKGENRIVWRSQNLRIGKKGLCTYYDLDALIKAICEIGSLTFYVDEAHQVCNAWTSTPEFIRLIRLGRHWNVNIVWVSQRFATVHRELTANTDEFVFFRLWEPLDLDAVKNRCGVATANRVRELHRIKTGSDGKVIPGEHLVFNVLEQ